MKTAVQQKFSKYIDAQSGEYLFRTTGNLGRSEANGKTIETSTPGVVWARTTNGVEMQVYNSVAPPIWDTHILIGVSKTLPNLTQIIGVRAVFPQPATQNFLVRHGEQHRLGSIDPVWADRKQILYLTIL